MLDILEQARKKYLTFRNPNIEADEELLNTQEKRFGELARIQELLATPNGKILKKWVIDELERKFIELLKSENEKRDELISDLKSLFNLYNKLKVDSELNGIRKYLESLLEE